MARKPNLILFGIDSLRSDHMSLYGYPRQTTPHIDAYARGGCVYENCISTHIPTTPGYSNMLTGMDAFGTDVVALRHRGPIVEGVPTLAELLRAEGYTSTCIGFEGNPAARGFDKYLHYEGFRFEPGQRMHKAEGLNQVALPELAALKEAGQPFFLFMRHMDPHSPYLPPAPYDRIFYGGDECDPGRPNGMKPVFEFKPFRDYFASWLSESITDPEYVNALYDGGIAYMDACIQVLLTAVADMGLEEETLVVIDSDHGETLDEHDCYFDHHGLYEPTLTVPLIFRMPGRVPAGKRFSGNTTLMDVTPTILDILGIRTKLRFDGVSLFPEMRGKPRVPQAEHYLTECTWMRKHGWRTPEWKLIQALEPDFHFKPEIELYNLVEDPGETVNLAKKEKAVVELLLGRMNAWIARREKATGRPNPMRTNLHWHGHGTIQRPFESSEEAYNALHIGDPETARKLQARLKE